MIKAEHTIKQGAGKTIKVKGYDIGKGLFLHRALEYEGNEQTKRDYWTVTHVNSGLSVIKFENYPVKRKTILEHIGILTALDWDCSEADISKNREIFFNARLSFTNIIREVIKNES